MQYQSETKNCQNCKKDFTIEPDDFSFYEKIKVPAPTFCPECRIQRRMIWRNEHKLFKKKDFKTGQEIFSQYHPDSPIKIYSNEYWVSDEWDPMDYGFNYDFSKSFFSQFKDLLYTVPEKSRLLTNAVNSEYCANVDEMKNCYLCFNAILLSDCGYTVSANKLRDSYDITTCTSLESCYDSFGSTDSNNIQSCSDCGNSINLLYCIDCRNCQNCVGCVGLRNKNNCIFNIQYSKEEYIKKIAEFNIGSYNSRQKIKTIMLELYSIYPRRYMHILKSANCSGDYIFGSKNTIKSWLTQKTEDVKYSQDTRYSKDVYDSLVCWKAEQIYESTCCYLESSLLKFTFNCHPNNFDLTYCAYCLNSSHLFGCVGLNNKEYCIFNKQYKKEEYQKLVDQIIEQMKNIEYVSISGNSYKYGEFFPPELSPLAYNETIAQEFFPLTDIDARNKGFLWRYPNENKYIPTVKSDQIPDCINDVTNSIINEIFECSDRGECKHDCTKAFRIIQAEFDFYRKMNIPLPKKCPNCRYGERLYFRGGIKYWKRKCMCNLPDHNHENLCTNEFETSYAPERPEIVYCEKCYQQEVY